MKYKYYRCSRKINCAICNESYINWDLNPIFITKSNSSICQQCITFLEKDNADFACGLESYDFGDYYISNIDYDFMIDAPATESVTFVGNTTIWNGVTK